MPKIPWTPPKRPPRIKVEEPPEPPTNPCPTCKGVGHREFISGKQIQCWVCKGSGKALPPPPDGDMHSDGSQPSRWDGQRDTVAQSQQRINRFSAGTHDQP